MCILYTNFFISIFISSFLIYTQKLFLLCRQKNSKSNADENIYNIYSHGHQHLISKFSVLIFFQFNWSLCLLIYFVTFLFFF